MVVFALMGAAMLDTCVLSWSTPRDHFRMIAGKKENVSGKLARPVDPALLKTTFTHEGGRLPEDLSERVLDYDPRYPGLKLRFLSIEGRLWRGELEAHPDVQEGDYPIRIFRAGEKPDDTAARFHLRVFSDEKSYRNSFWSLSKRLVGLEPWWIALMLLPVSLFCLYRVMRHTTEVDAALMAEGIAPIYKLARQKTHWEVLFGLGSVHGVQKGDRLTILGPDRKTLGAIEAEEVGPESSTGHLSLDAEITPDCRIRKSGNKTKGST